MEEKTSLLWCGFIENDAKMNAGQTTRNILGTFRQKHFFYICATKK